MFDKTFAAGDPQQLVGIGEKIVHHQQWSMLGADDAGIDAHVPIQFQSWLRRRLVQMTQVRGVRLAMSLEDHATFG